MDYIETMADAGKKRKSDGVPVIKRIGKLSFNRNDVLGRGSFGASIKASSEIRLTLQSNES